MDKLSGIYQIRNLINGKKYIGQSIDLERRKKDHFRYLKGNYHKNIHLQNAYNFYGQENFVFEVLVYCESNKEELTKREQFFVDSESQENLYNILIKCVNSNLGVGFSEETKKKLSKSRSGKNNPMWGKHHIEESKKKMSEALLGRKVSEETKQKISKNHADVSGKNNPNYGKFGEDNPLYGRRHTEETKEKMSKARSGKNNPWYGKHHTKETKEKMSKSNSGENNGGSKLTKEQVLEILILYYNNGNTQRFISNKYNVNQQCISLICSGKRWANIFFKFCEESDINISEEDNDGLY